ncbi:uncharacterized protein NEMAJ01_2413, partial [Nematocida major]|uniref:uncharacterized protein n=1 Tax=Nematocida major TaxID=1912982 RepID=UPI002007882E
KNSLKSILRKLDCFIAITSSDNVSICAAEVALYVKEYPEDSRERLAKILRRMPGGGKEFSAEVMGRVQI